MTPYIGEERRKNMDRDHDLLTTINANLSTHMKAVEQHLLDDKEAFKAIENRIGWLQKIVFVGIGGLAVLKFFIR